MKKCLTTIINNIKNSVNNNNHEIKTSFLKIGPLTAAISTFVITTFTHYSNTNYVGINYLTHLEMSLRSIPQLYLGLSSAYLSLALLEKKYNEQPPQEEIVDVEFEEVFIQHSASPYSSHPQDENNYQYINPKLHE